MMQPATHIQVVDDDAVVLESLVAILESWGFDVDAFPDAESFERAAANSPADCILLDVKLDGTDGLTLLQTLRAGGIETPVIVVTGHGDVSMAVRALHSGAQDFVEKIAWFLEHPEERQRIAQQGRRFIREHYRLEPFVAHIVELMDARAFREGARAD